MKRKILIFRYSSSVSELTLTPERFHEADQRNAQDSPVEHIKNSMKKGSEAWKFKKKKNTRCRFNRYTIIFRGPFSDQTVQ